jgi:hypothetical protein
MLTDQLNSLKPVSVRAKEVFDIAQAVLIVHPILTKRLGIHCAHLINQIDYWLQNPRAGYIVEGKKWIWNSYSDWSKQLPWLSVDQVGRCVRAMENKGYIISDNFNNNSRDRRKWYRLNYEKLAEELDWSPRKFSFKKVFQQSQPDLPESDLPESDLQSCRLDLANTQNPICNFADSSIYKSPPKKTILSGESEKKFFENEEEQNNSYQKEKIPSCNTKPLVISNKLSQDNKTPSEEKYSAAAPEKSLNNPDPLKPVEKDYALKGFVSQKERDGFYQKLLELGQNKSGIYSPVGWVASIIQSINAGAICEYLNEYRRGVPIGTCEKKEWEIVPGKPLPQFVSYLKRRFRSNLLTDEQAIAAAHKALRDPNAAADLWSSCKRTIQKTSQQWKRDESFGISTPYLPPELLPENEVELAEAAEAMRQLQSASIQYPTPALQRREGENSDSKILPNSGVHTVSLSPTSGSDEVSKLEPAPDLEKIKQDLEQKRAKLELGAIGQAIAISWSRAYPGIVELVKDENGKVIDLKLVEEEHHSQ